MREAEKRFLEALEEAKLGFGPGDAHVASCLNNLAEFYRNTGRYGEAEGRYKEVSQGGGWCWRLLEGRLWCGWGCWCC